MSTQELSAHAQDIARSDVGSLNRMVLGDDDCEIERIETLVSSDPETNPELAALRSAAVIRFRAASTGPRARW